MSWIIGIVGALAMLVTSFLASRASMRTETGSGSISYMYTGLLVKFILAAAMAACQATFGDNRIVFIVFLLIAIIGAPVIAFIVGNKENAARKNKVTISVEEYEKLQALQKQQEEVA